MKAESAERLTAPEKKIDDGSLTTHAVWKAIFSRFKVDKWCSLKNILKFELSKLFPQAQIITIFPFFFVLCTSRIISLHADSPARPKNNSLLILSRTQANFRDKKLDTDLL